MRVQSGVIVSLAALLAVSSAFGIVAAAPDPYEIAVTATLLEAEYSDVGYGWVLLAYRRHIRAQSTGQILASA